MGAAQYHASSSGPASGAFLMSDSMEAETPISTNPRTCRIKSCTCRLFAHIAQRIKSPGQKEAEIHPSQNRHKCQPPVRTAEVQWPASGFSCLWRVLRIDIVAADHLPLSLVADQSSYHFGNDLPARKDQPLGESGHARIGESAGHLEVGNRRWEP